MLKLWSYWPWNTVSSDLNSWLKWRNASSKCMSCHARIHLSKFWLSGCGGGELFLECDQKLNQKRDEANEKLRKLFPKILSQAEHKKFQSRFLLEQLRWLSLVVMFGPKRNATTMCGTSFPSFPYWVFIPLLPESVRAVFRTLTW